MDVDPASPHYSKVISRLPMPYKGDELHHTGWNACSSCSLDPSAKRSLMIMPCLGSGRVYAVDTSSDPRAPKLHKVVESAEILGVTGLANLHTSHCLGSGDVMISATGDSEGNGRWAG